MTTIQNTELLPDGTPVGGVLVEVRIYGPTPAAMSSGTNSVVGTAWTRSNSSGYWSMDLIPNSLIEPEGTCYIFTRTYPPTVTGMERGGGKSIEYGIVPPDTVPVDYAEIVVSSPTAQPFTDSELFYHLNDADPHPQYLTQTEGDARYAGIGSGGGGSLPTSEPHTFISDWDSALATKSLSSFATPTGNLPMGGKKVTGLAPGTDPTDAATVGQVTTPTGVLLIANNLSDVANASTARNNLGLGSAATHPASDFAPSTIGGWLSGAGAPSSGSRQRRNVLLRHDERRLLRPQDIGIMGIGNQVQPLGVRLKDEHYRVLDPLHAPGQRQRPGFGLRWWDGEQHHGHRPGELEDEQHGRHHQRGGWDALDHLGRHISAARTRGSEHRDDSSPWPVRCRNCGLPVQQRRAHGC